MEHTHRLYRLGLTEYIQHIDPEPLPPRVEEYCLLSGGEHPPFIPLPIEGVEFCVAREGYAPKILPWDGKTPLPDAVIQYVCEYGTLPSVKTMSSQWAVAEEAQYKRGV